jgi:hypothetical protein
LQQCCALDRVAGAPMRRRISSYLFSRFYDSANFEVSMRKPSFFFDFFVSRVRAMLSVTAGEPHFEHR